MIRGIFLQAPRTARCSRLVSPSFIPKPTLSRATPNATPTSRSRTYVTKTSADEKIEDLQELYATAKDEFEIASEETDKKTVYAAADREAAAEEFLKLKQEFEKALSGTDGEEIQRRIGQRVRELEGAVEALEERGKED